MLCEVVVGIVSISIFVEIPKVALHEICQQPVFTCKVLQSEEGPDVRLASKQIINLSLAQFMINSLN